MRINLHSHSNKSDGINTPKELIDTFAKEDLDVIALTDHDTIAGLPEAKQLCKKLGIALVPGVEFSVSLANCPLSFTHEHMAFHLLAYGFDLAKMQERIKDHHNKINNGIRALVKELNEMGYKLDVNELPKNDYWSKYDIAVLLVKKGYASRIWDTVENVIMKAKNRRVFFYSPKEMIDLIHDCGGLAFMAHPFDFMDGEFKTRIKSAKPVRELLNYLVSVGIDGIEARYQPYDEETQEYLVEYANKNNLLISYGTDYHGRGSGDNKYFEVEELPAWVKQIITKRRWRWKRYLYITYCRNQIPLNLFRASLLKL